MRTAATDLVGIEFPILGFSHCRDVVAAVTKAGGFGVLGAVAHTPEQLDIDLTWIEEEVGAGPTASTCSCPRSTSGADDGGLDRAELRQLLPDGHREFLDDLLAATTCRRSRRRRRRSAARRHACRPEEHGAAAGRAFAHQTRSSPPRSARRRRHHRAGRTRGVPVAALAG